MSNSRNQGRMVKVIGPVYKDKYGNVVSAYKEREMPYNIATSEHVRALGVTLVEDVVGGFAPDPRKSKAEAEIAGLRAQLAEKELKIATLETKKTETKDTKKSA